MIRYIDAHRQEFGVEPICTALQVAPSTYYGAKSRPPCRRRVADEALKADIARVFEANYRVYGPARCGVSSTARASPCPAAESSD